MTSRNVETAALFMVLIVLAISPAWHPAPFAAEHPGKSVVFYVY